MWNYPTDKSISWLLCVIGFYVQWIIHGPTGFTNNPNSFAKFSIIYTQIIFYPPIHNSQNFPLKSTHGLGPRF